MKMKALTLLTATLIATTAQAQTLFSDDFEANLAGLNRTPSGWTITNDGTVDILGPAAFGDLCAGSGTCVDLDGSTGTPGVLSRSINLAAGTTYTLSFDIAGNRRNGGLETGVVTLGSATMGYSLTGSDSNAAYQSMSLAFTPMSTGLYSLSFANDGSDTYGAILDNVALTVSVPEPGSVAMLLLGLVGLMLIKGRRA